MRKISIFLVFAFAFAFLSAFSLVGMQDVKAEGSSYDDLLKRIEALEQSPNGNVSAPKITGLKIGFDIRHRFELRDEPFAMTDANGNKLGTAHIAENILVTYTDPITGETVTESLPEYQLYDTAFFSSGTHESLAGYRVLFKTVPASTEGPGSSTTQSITDANGKNIIADEGARGYGETSEFVLQRVRLTLDADVNKHVHGLIKLQDSRTFGAEGALGPDTIVNLERTDLLEGYAELRNLGDFSSWLNGVELRIGRWQMAYGNQRLLGHLNWANEGRSYDGARLKWNNKKNAWIDVFAFEIDEKESGGASGDTDGMGKIDEVLYGVYSQFKVYPGNVFEPYFIARARSNDVHGATQGSGEDRYTLGFRLDGRKIPGLGGFDYTIEPAWQFGDTEGLGKTDVNTAGETDGITNTIQAFAIYAGAGYRFSNLWWQPRVGYAFVYASGDESPDRGAAKTFDHLYPTGHAQLGYIDYVAWQNIEDHQVHLNLKPCKKVVIDVKGHFFDLDEEADAWYNVAGGTGYGGGQGMVRQGADYVGTLDSNGEFQTFQAVDDELGQELDITVKYKMLKNFSVVAGYSHFWSGDFVDDTGNDVDEDVDWVYLQTTLKF